MVHDGGGWRVVAARWLAGGYGFLRFDVVGDSLRLSFRGQLVLAARSSAVLSAGGSGLHSSGPARASFFVAIPLG
jgi:hypothetical protein